MHEKILKSRWLGKDNVFVVTGGFKSLLPAATLYAMVFEMPIYYLFEKSDKLWQLEKGWNKVTATGISKLEVTKLSDENNQIEARLKLQTTIPPDVELESKI
jgi:pyridoxal biosynthesis lyase PdxS